MSKRFKQIFPMPKPILGMLHLGGESAADRLALARQETETLIANGVDGLVVENYFGDKDDARAVLDWLKASKPPVLIGLNVLRDFRLAFELAQSYPVDFIQVDSVAGHLEPADDADYAAELAALRAGTGAALLGGVRFKYQPVKSGRSEEEDLRLGMQRCDAIVVTSDATGQPTDLAKVARFRTVTGSDFPLLIGAGMTLENAAEQLAVTEGAVVGSYFKDTHKDKGIVHGPHVAEFMQVVKKVRAGLTAQNGEA